MNYNDGNWHGWNGGECPVHPETVVDVLWNNFGRYSDYVGVAGDPDWNETLCPVIAFRVIKEHKERREFKVVYNGNGTVTLLGSPIDHFHAKPGEIIHVREVLE